jgi:C-terminal processing protease CtpA/Prc
MPMYAEAPGAVPPDPKRHYSKPVLVLTSAATYSAAEDFAVAFDGMQRGSLVGEATGGSTGQPLFIKLPGGGGARICTKQDTYPDGRAFVGIGVQPQHIVKPTVEGVRAGRDEVLEAALATLKAN